MRKAVLFTLFYMIVVLVQFFFSKYFNVYGISPNFILVTIVYLGVARGKLESEIIGFLFGATWDIFSTDVFGIRIVLLTVIGFLAGMLSRNFDKDQTVTQIFIVSVASLLYWLGFSVISFGFPNGVGSFVPFDVSFRSVLGFVLTLAITPIVFYIADKFFDSENGYF